MRLLAALALTLAAAAPAQAVVGGKRVPASAVPWFASFDGCGGTLVAPDRVVTAGHCVRGASLDELGRIRVAGETRRPLHFAMHPDWQHTNGGNLLDDVAVIQLDAPVTTVAPVPLAAGAVQPRALVLGRGASTSDRRRAGTLREATLRTMSDRVCARVYRRARGNDQERFNAPRMLCAIDVNGRPPLASACVGDSGGPLYVGTHTAPVLFGIVSFGGDRCGADRLPSVFTEVARYREFILAPAPVWAPAATGPSKITGEARVGGELTCTVPGWDPAPERVIVRWIRFTRGDPIVSHAPTYRPRRADAGHGLACIIEGRTAGGPSLAPVDRGSGVRVARR